MNKSHQSARIPNTRYPKMEPTNRENFAMWTFQAESHTRLHCRGKETSPLAQGHALCRFQDVSILFILLGQSNLWGPDTTIQIRLKE